MIMSKYLLSIFHCSFSQLTAIARMICKYIAILGNLQYIIIRTSDQYIKSIIIFFFWGGGTSLLFAKGLVALKTCRLPMFIVLNFEKIKYYRYLLGYYIVSIITNISNFLLEFMGAWSCVYTICMQTLYVVFV